MCPILPPPSIFSAGASGSLPAGLGLFSVTGDRGLVDLDLRMIQRQPFNPATGAGDYICFSQVVFGSSPAANPFDAFRYRLANATTHNFSLSLQHELFRNNVLTVGYAGQRGSDLESIATSTRARWEEATDRLPTNFRTYITSCRPPI
jgi:hypothetical protein